MSIINTNMSSLVSQKNLSHSRNALGTAMERLSSGMRINSAKDDAAGQAIANRMNSQIKGMAQAQRNANDGISMIQTTEGALNQINNNLQRVRELAVQAASDTNDVADRESIQTEITERINEIDRVAKSASFNGIKLADGTNTSLKIQIGANTEAEDSITINLTDGTTAGLSVDDLVAGAVSDSVKAYATIDAVDDALKTVDTARSGLGATLNRFDSVISNLQNSETNLSAARSRIEDADYAKEVAEMTRAQILQQAGTSVLAQANQIPQGVLSLLR
ncbi:MAG: flagellin [Pseudomonas sp.]